MGGWLAKSGKPGALQAQSVWIFVGLRQVGNEKCNEPVFGESGIKETTSKGWLFLEVIPFLIPCISQEVWSKDNAFPPIDKWLTWTICGPFPGAHAQRPFSKSGAWASFQRDSAEHLVLIFV